jgi:uncharacterized protein
MSTFKISTLYVCGLLSLCVHAPSIAASFPCEKASTPVERLICQDKELSDYDEYLGRYYSAARSVLPQATQCIAVDQRQWLRRVRDVCKDTLCLKKAYLLRLGELNGVQPGATVLRNLKLPDTPTLVAIIPPAEDQIAAPRRPNPVPMAVTGKLLNEVSDGDGYVVLAKDGRKHLLVGLMFLDDSTANLEWLSKAASTDYLVKGAASAEEAGSVSFSQAACRYIYRVQ